MIRSSRYGLELIDLYFNEQIGDLTADLIRYHYWSEAVPGSIVGPQWTVVVDVGNEPEALLADMTSSTRRDIRRAEREERLSYNIHHPEGAGIRGFLRFFRGFAHAHAIDEPK